MANLTPEELLEIHKEYADKFTAIASAGLYQAFARLSDSSIFDYQPSQIAITSPVIGDPKQVGQMPKSPASPNIEPLTQLDLFKDIPNEFYGSVPSARYGDAPEFADIIEPGAMRPFLLVPPDVPQDVPLPDTPSYITMPDFRLPVDPGSIVVPDKPVLSMPVFEGIRPADIQPADPESIIDRYTSEQDSHRNALPAFMSAQADALISKYAPEYNSIRTRISQAVIDYTDPTSGGGAGIPANIEGAIAARASDRNALEFQRALDTASQTISKQGFSIPPGALLATLRQARTAMGDAQVRGNVEIATKNFELEQRNFEFMLKMGQALDEKMKDMIVKFFDLTLKIDELSIMSAKEIVSAYLGAYNIQVMVYKAMWDGYQADAAVFRARIEALDSQVRLYEAEIRAELAKNEVNTAYVNMLRAAADTNQSIAATYKIQIDAAMAPIEIAKVLTQLYEAQVRGFVAEVGVKESEWNAYKAQIDGEIAKQRAWQSKVEAYSAEVGGFKAKVDSYTAQVQGFAEANRAIASSNDAKLREFSTKAEVAIKTYEGLLQAYNVESSAILKQSEIEIEYWRTKANVIMSEWTTTMNQTFEFAREQMNLFRGQMEAAISAGNGLAHAANVAGALAGGAMGGLTSFAGNLVSSQE